jgi:hypothetical protein
MVAGGNILSMGTSPGIGSRGRNPNQHFGNIIICIFDQQRLRADEFQKPPHRQAANVVRNLTPDK